ncbi:dihydroorotate dehydrogenase [Vallitalea longa]|uniref:Dihydroorotate dehydrogenase n=1 Tax=Vallitalea longa TaxID=2936439 RepID=A0A9W5Y7W9_9FIRM|nr:dihydroorotate dehydrogenase [Vallitalea longa]GKX28019.1 dihydroorotate dehydrogenase [Vallitalea longa]
MMTSVNIAGVDFKNPVMTASGTFGSGREYSKFVDLNRLGGVVVKGVASKEWLGNPAPRIAETYGGMLNAVGLQNPGVDVFIEEDIPFLRQYDTNIIVNIAGKTVEEYVEVAKRLRDADIDMIELNISCPNVKEGGVAFGTDPKMAEYVTSEVKKYAKQPLIVKLSPNVTDITEIARAVEAGGADAVSLINTLLGMKIDIYKRKPILANRVGGFSGPAIKPVAVRMVNQVYNSIKLPIIGLGGICTGEDAIEFILAGATGVAVGTANFSNPRATIDVVEGIERYMDVMGVGDVNELIGNID